MQTWRWIELLQLLQLLGVTTISSHSHVGNQALGEVYHRFVDAFLWQLFPDGLQDDFQLISRLKGCLYYDTCTAYMCAAHVRRTCAMTVYAEHARCF